MSEYIWSDLEEAVTSIDPFDPEFYEDAGLITVFYGVFLGFTLLSFFSAELFHRTKLEESFKEKRKVKHHVSQHLSHNAEDKIKHFKETNRFKMYNFIESFFPGTYANDHTNKRFSRELLGHHLVVHLFTTEVFFDRCISTLIIATTMIFSAFLTALLLDIQYPTDDGSCNDFDNEIDCLDTRSIFNSDETKCQWKYGVNGVSYDTCYWIKPPLSLFSMASIVIIVIIIASPVYVLLDILNSE